MNSEDEEARALALERLLDWLTDLFRLHVLASTRGSLQSALAEVPAGLRELRSEFLEDLWAASASDAELRRWLPPFDAAMASLQAQLLAEPGEEELRKAGIASQEAQHRPEPPTTPD